jgi:hypothetical protein
MRYLYALTKIKRSISIILKAINNGAAVYKILTPPPPPGGGDKSGLWVKKYHKKNDCADKKRRT